MQIIDMHCDTIYKCYSEGTSMIDRPGHLNFELMKKNNALAQFFAIFLPVTEEDGKKLDPRALFDRIYDVYISELEKNRDIIRPALNYEDIMRNSKDNKMSAILTIEDSDLIQNDISELTKLYDKGVRLMTLLWNNINCIGYPSSIDPKEHQKGLKPFGIEAVEEMNRLGIIVDVSHLSEGGFYDVARYSKKPFVASHSCVRALCDHQRNLTDQQLKIIGNKGGVVGVNFNAGFLKKDADYAYIEEIIRHIEYIVNIAGSDSTALGSDFDGIGCGLEMADYSGYGQLIDRMCKQLTVEVVEKICSKNVLRIIKGD